MPEIADHHLNVEAQIERCRRLEMAVLIQALVDAVWTPPDWTDKDDRRRRSDLRSGELRRLEVRNWFLDRDPKHREHIEAIADSAGMPDGYIWRLVERFLIDGEDPAPVHAMHARMRDMKLGELDKMDRNASRWFDGGEHYENGNEAPSKVGQLEKDWTMRGPAYVAGG